MKKISNPDVAFDRYPRKMKQKLMTLRQLIFEVAAETEKVGELEERSNGASLHILRRDLIRIDVKKSDRQNTQCISIADNGPPTAISP